jgi:hypothetical protein
MENVNLEDHFCNDCKKLIFDEGLPYCLVYKIVPLTDRTISKAFRLNICKDENKKELTKITALEKIKKAIKESGLTKCESMDCNNCEFDSKSPEADQFNNANICILLNEVYKTEIKNGGMNV